MNPLFYRSPILSRLAQAMVSNLEYLDLMRKREHTPGIAWTVRNILELNIWIAYCSRSEENAKSFYEDSARDAIDMLHVPDGMIKEGRLEAFKATRERLLAVVAESHIENPTSFMKIHEVAVAVGFANFGKVNKFLSKWAHPTALNVLGGDTAKIVSPFFIEMGIVWSDQALEQVKLITNQP